MSNAYSAYILAGFSRTLYTGVTDDLQRRMKSGSLTPSPQTGPGSG